jgi:hypothetical protein
MGNSHSSNDKYKKYLVAQETMPGFFKLTHVHFDFDKPSNCLEWKETHHCLPDSSCSSSADLLSCVMSQWVTSPLPSLSLQCLKHIICGKTGRTAFIAPAAPHETTITLVFDSGDVQLFLPEICDHPACAVSVFAAAFETISFSAINVLEILLDILNLQKIGDETKWPELPFVTTLNRSTHSYIVGPLTPFSAALFLNSGQLPTNKTIQQQVVGEEEKKEKEEKLALKLEYEKQAIKITNAHLGNMMSEIRGQCVAWHCPKTGILRPGFMRFDVSNGWRYAYLTWQPDLNNMVGLSDRAEYRWLLSSFKSCKIVKLNFDTVRLSAYETHLYRPRVSVSLKATKKKKKEKHKEFEDDEPLRFRHAEVGPVIVFAAILEKVFQWHDTGMQTASPWGDEQIAEIVCEDLDACVPVAHLLESLRYDPEGVEALKRNLEVSSQDIVTNCECLGIV